MSAYLFAMNTSGRSFCYYTTPFAAALTGYLSSHFIHRICPKELHGLHEDAAMIYQAVATVAAVYVQNQIKNKNWDIWAKHALVGLASFSAGAFTMRILDVHHSGHIALIANTIFSFACAQVFTRALHSK